MLSIHADERAKYIVRRKSSFSQRTIDARNTLSTDCLHARGVQAQN